MGILYSVGSFEFQALVFVVACIATVFSYVLSWHAIQPEIPGYTKKLLIVLTLTLWLGVSYGAWHMYKKVTGVPTIQKTSPITGDIINPKAPDISVMLSAPVRVKSLNIHTFPEIDFSTSSPLPWSTTVTLVPKTTLPPGERIMVYVSNIEGPFTKGYGGEQLLEVMTPETDVSETSPTEGSKDLPVKQQFTITVTTPVDVKEWSVRMDLDIPVTIKKESAKTFTVTPNEPFKPNTRYTMTIIHTPIITDRSSDQEIRKLDPVTKETIHFATVPSAFISSFKPEGNATNPSEDILISFDQPMNTDDVVKNLSILPNVELRPAWQDDDKTLVLTHDTLAKNTEYSLTLAKGTTTAKGGILENDATFRFHTAGPLKISGSSPVNNATGVSVKSIIKLTFDQNIKDSVEGHLTIVPNIPGKSTVKDNTLEFIPDKELPYETTYTVTVTKDAESEFGLPSAGDEKFVFTTSPNQMSLAVPFYRQQTLFTCNIAAARMLLAFRGINVTEADLINTMGLGGKRGSGNPYKGYIDDYGTYWDAVSRGVSKYRNTRMITNGSIADLIAEVKKGNPVMTWGQNGWSDPHDISWTSTDGTFIKAVNGMHSAVVRGYSGPDDNPTQIFINDPWRGQYALSTAEFMRRWSYFKMAMVIE